MNFVIVLIVVRYGVVIVNYVEVVSLFKKIDFQIGKVCVSGVWCKDVFIGQEFDVRVKCVINVMGFFMDFVCKMDDKDVVVICQLSVGVYIVMFGYYSFESMGFFDLVISDG